MAVWVLRLKEYAWRILEHPLESIHMSLFEESISKLPTIEKWLLENDLKHIVLLKKVLIRPVTLRKRLNFA